VFSVVQAYFLPTHGNGEVPVLGKLPYVDAISMCIVTAIDRHFVTIAGISFYNSGSYLKEPMLCMHS
jgi:hypothetical protein